MDQEMQTERRKFYNETRQLFLAGKLTNGAAAKRLLDHGGWSFEEAGLAVQMWRKMKEAAATDQSG